jgi:hypothetical protein
MGQGCVGSLSTGHLSDSIAMGQFVLGSMTTGTSSHIVAFGNSALGTTTACNKTIAIGFSALGSLTTGDNNTAIGYNSLAGLGSGTRNIAYGFNSGQGYVGTESDNIVIGNDGTAAESNTTRIGTQGSGAGQQNKAFIAGIVGVTVSNAQTVVIDSSTGQLGVSSGDVVTWNVVSTNQTGTANNGYIFVSAGGALTISLPTTSAVGDEFIVALDGATSWRITQAAGQQIRVSSSTTTLGATGTLTSTAQGDSVTLVCRVANTLWTAIAAIGNLTPA